MIIGILSSNLLWATCPPSQNNIQSDDFDPTIESCISEIPINRCACARNPSDIQRGLSNSRDAQELENEAKLRLNKRVANYLLDSTKMNLLEIANQLNYLGEANSGQNPTCEPFKDLTPTCPGDVSELVFNDRASIIGDLKSEFNNEILIRYGTEPPGAKGLFERTSNKHSSSCKMTEAMSIRAKAQADYRNLKKLVQFIHPMGSHQWGQALHFTPCHPA